MCFGVPSVSSITPREHSRSSLSCFWMRYIFCVFISGRGFAGRMGSINQTGSRGENAPEGWFVCERAGEHCPRRLEASVNRHSRRRTVACLPRSSFLRGPAAATSSKASLSLARSWAEQNRWHRTTDPWTHGNNGLHGKKQGFFRHTPPPLPPQKAAQRQHEQSPERNTTIQNNEQRSPPPRLPPSSSGRLSPRVV